MSFNYTLKYRTFDQLMAEVAIDFPKYDLESLISPEQLLKVVKRVNYDLGLRIMKTKEELLEVEKGNVKLPNDFYSLNYGLICDETQVSVVTPQGTFIDERLITPYQDAPPETDVCDPPQINCRTTVAGCACACSDACGCSGNCNGLCPQCSSENALCNTTVVTNETVQEPDIRDEVHSCSWFIPTDYAPLAEVYTIVIDGVEYTVDPGDIPTLNGLGLGSFEIFLNTSDSNYYIFVVGTHTYGDLVMYNAGSPILTMTPNCGTVTTYTNDDKVCAWIMSKKIFDGIQDWEITIDGNLYVISGLMTTALTQLNALGLGVFTAILDSHDSIVITVTGNHTYDSFAWGAPPKPTTAPKVCTPITTTPGSTTTTITTENNCYTNPPVCAPRIELACNGDQYELVQVVNPAKTYTYKRLLPLKILPNGESIDCGCPNLYINSANTAWIRDNYLYANFATGKVYINYQGHMEDDDHNLMVPDHDGLNDYYEYAVKSRILENLMMNDEIPGKKIELIEMRLRQAKIYAHTVVNTPNFSELRDIWRANRKAQYSKYYDMFKSFTGTRWTQDPSLNIIDNPSNNT